MTQPNVNLCVEGGHSGCSSCLTTEQTRQVTAGTSVGDKEVVNSGCVVFLLDKTVKCFC